MFKARAFTLIEILVVVVLLGILAAIIIPTIAQSSTAAKESALATDLQLLRRFVLIYKCQHLEIGPGYPNGDISQVPTKEEFINQATMASNAAGQTAAPGTNGFNRGPYMMKIPFNPLNDSNDIRMLGNGEDFPADPDAGNSFGWIYKAATGEVRADSTGSDSSDKRYYDY